MKKLSEKVSFEKMNKEELEKLKGGNSGKVAEGTGTVDGGTLDEVTVQAVASVR